MEQPSEHDELIWAAFDGMLDEPARREFREQLVSNATLARRLLELSLEEAMLKDVLAEAHILETVRTEALGVPPRRLLRFPRLLRSAVVPLAAAAALAFVLYYLGIVRIAPRAGDAVAEVTHIEGGVRVKSHADDTWRGAEESESLALGQTVRIATGGKLTFLYKDGTRIEARSGPATLHFQTPRHRSAKALRLDEGVLYADVCRQTEPMILSTPHACVTVLGTRFMIATGSRLTSANVTEGLVKLARIADGKSIKVSTGALAATGPELAPVLWELSPKYDGLFFRKYADHYEKTGFALESLPVREGRRLESVAPHALPIRTYCIRRSSRPGHKVYALTICLKLTKTEFVGPDGNRHEAVQISNGEDLDGVAGFRLAVPDVHGFVCRYECAVDLKNDSAFRIQAAYSGDGLRHAGSGNAEPYDRWPEKTVPRKGTIAVTDQLLLVGQDSFGRFVYERRSFVNGRPVQVAWCRASAVDGEMHFSVIVGHGEAHILSLTFNELHVGEKNDG